ncbi:acyl carrier protein [Arenibacter sp. TNZ]|jgi:acyl carrier protein|uniref:acyl carrier protein n=1 Tax=Arenibacter TaxID=178469 RepID=UPI000CD3F91A|nr:MULTISPECIES: phosphopantetheine-binding protein [Arenibacter]MCM4173256.1 acyl carrier protein [Arenibacter sp. TNZ]
MDDNDQRLARLKGIVKTYLPEDVSIDSVGVESNFVTELNINSAHLVDIVLDLEDAFGIRLENEDMDQMQTVKDALNIIDQKLLTK